MSDYQPYVEHLNELVQALIQGDRSAIGADAVDEALLDGAPDALRRLVALQDRMDSGAFFTSPALADLAWAPLLPTLDQNSIIVDPSCGAGSLLIPGLRALLPAADPLRAARQIRGCDVASTFLAAARARLMLTVASSQPGLAQRDLVNLRFPGLQQGDALTQMERLLEGATHIAVSPPYTPITAPADCAWARGEITHAALFVDEIVRHMPANCRMVAILPDILQTGFRYAKWRAAIRHMATIDRITHWGTFDSHTGVDVFLMYLTKRDMKRSASHGGLTALTRLAARRRLR